MNEGKARLIAELCVILDVVDRDVLDACKSDKELDRVAQSLITEAKYASEDYNTKDVRTVMWIAEHVESVILA